MTMIYTPDGLLYAKKPLAELAELNNTDAKIDIRIWEFSGISEDAARKRAIFNNWFLSVMKRRFIQDDGIQYHPDSRFRVLPPDLEAIVLERLDDDGSVCGCPAPNQPYKDPNQIVYLWAAWVMTRLSKHNDVRSSYDYDWDILDSEADEEERGYTQDVKRREHEEAYKQHLLSRPTDVKQQIMLTGHPRLIKQVMDWISLINRHLERGEDAVRFEYVAELPAAQKKSVKTR